MADQSCPNLGSGSSYRGIRGHLVGLLRIGRRWLRTGHVDLHLVYRHDACRKANRLVAAMRGGWLTVMA
jgi:hypothetical protein